MIRWVLAGVLAITTFQAIAQTRDTPFRIEPQVIITPPVQTAPSPYVGFETRDVKTLSAERIEGLKRGDGLGYALAAELNGYPGPRHVLDIGDQLELTQEQRQRTSVVYDRMRRDAVAAGEALIAAEAHLSRLFEMRQATHARIEAQTAVAAAQEARLRAVHLDAHLAMMEILAPAQIESYNRLRGYQPNAEHGGALAHPQHDQGKVPARAN